MYEYKFELDRVVDGDTIDVDIALGFDVMLKKQRIRLHGLNTPESRTRDLEEKKYGLAAKARLKEILEGAETLSLKTAIDKKARGKYGRILGTIFADEVNINHFINEFDTFYYDEKKGKWIPSVDVVHVKPFTFELGGEIEKNTVLSGGLK